MEVMLLGECCLVTLLVLQIKNCVYILLLIKQVWHKKQDVLLLRIINFVSMCLC